MSPERTSGFYFFLMMMIFQRLQKGYDTRVSFDWTCLFKELIAQVDNKFMTNIFGLLSGNKLKDY